MTIGTATPTQRGLPPRGWQARSNRALRLRTGPLGAVRGGGGADRGPSAMSRSRSPPRRDR